MTNLTEFSISGTEQLILFLIVFAICMVGSYGADMVDLIRQKIDKIIYKYTIITALLVAIILWCFSESLIGWIGFKPYLALCLLGGLLSNEITTKLNTFAGLKQLMTDVKEVKKAAVNIKADQEKVTEDKKEVQKE